MSWLSQFESAIAPIVAPIITADTGVPVSAGMIGGNSGSPGTPGSTSPFDINGIIQNENTVIHNGLLSAQSMVLNVLFYVAIFIVLIVALVAILAPSENQIASIAQIASKVPVE